MDTPTSKQIADIIFSIPMFADLGPLEVRWLSQVVDWRRYPPGSFIFQEGDKGDTLYVIVRGKVEILKQKGEGEVLQIAALGRGTVLGEMSLLENERRSAAAFTTQETAMLEIKKEKLEKLFSRHAIIGYKVMKKIAVSLSQRLRRADSMIAHEVSHKIQEPDRAEL